MNVFINNHQLGNILGFVTDKALKALDSEGIIVEHQQSGDYEVEAGVSFAQAVQNLVEEIEEDPYFSGNAEEQAEQALAEYNMEDLEKAYQNNESWPVALGYIEEKEVTEAAHALFNNSLEWYVCYTGKNDVTDEDEFEVVHQTGLSSILECGEEPSAHGYTQIKQCWNWEPLFTEDDFE